MTNVTSPLPGSTFTPRGVRILKIAVAIMTAILLFGIVALVYGVGQQVSKLGTAGKPVAASVPPARTPYARVLDLGQGTLETVAASGDLVILHWKGEGSDTVLSIDPRNGNELGRIQVPHR
ncbi:MAG: hypothetical protein ACLPPF_08885 [Rhodomicrobium sp.]